ncbi:MAG: PhoH family protein [Rhodospirillales bacterium]|nr:PhoH family protein [Rhodospirillales bacterium]
MTTLENSQDNAFSQTLEFDDNSRLPQLFGAHNSHLALIESKLNVALNSRGNQVSVQGEAASVEVAQIVLNNLYESLGKGQDVSRQEVDAALRLAMYGEEKNGDAKDSLKKAGEIVIKTRKKTVNPRSATQAEYLKGMETHNLVFGTGPAGTGKTYLAVAKAVEQLINGKVDRIILSRPAVEAGEQLGFLPGDMREKVDPYLRPLYDALFDMLPEDQVTKKMENGEIEVAPLAFMRGRTLSNAFVILDEAQNTTAVQMKMFLTRLGEGSSMVITGDLSQVDLPSGTRSGLRDATEILHGVKGVSMHAFSEQDVVRHPLVARIVNAYEKVENKRRQGARYEKAPFANGKNNNNGNKPSQEPT